MSDLKLTEEEIEALALKNMENFGRAENAWHVDYGQILKDGQLTEAGEKLCADFPGTYLETYKKLGRFIE